jgi:hypothetical protein
VNFDELLGGDDLAPEEEEKLRRVHELLVEAGPPPDLPPALEHPAAPPQEADVIHYPFLARRRNAALAIVAVAAALTALAGGYAWGHSKAKPASLTAVRTVPMHGSAGQRPAGASEPARLLRALADAERQAGRSVRRLPRARRHDERDALGALQAEPLRRLGRHGTGAGAGRRARPGPGRPHHLARR